MLINMPNLRQRVSYPVSAGMVEVKGLAGSGNEGQAEADYVFGWVWGPFRITRVARGAKIGWVIRIEDNSSGCVEIRTTPKGKGMRVSQVLWRSEGEEPG